MTSLYPCAYIYLSDMLFSNIVHVQTSNMYITALTIYLLYNSTSCKLSMVLIYTSIHFFISIVLYIYFVLIIQRLFTSKKFIHLFGIRFYNLTVNDLWKSIGLH